MEPARPPPQPVDTMTDDEPRAMPSMVQSALWYASVGLRVVAVVALVLGLRG